MPPQIRRVLRRFVKRSRTQLGSYTYYTPPPSPKQCTSSELQHTIDCYTPNAGQELERVALCTGEHDEYSPHQPGTPGVVYLIRERIITATTISLNGIITAKFIQLGTITTASCISLRKLNPHTERTPVTQR